MTSSGLSVSRFCVVAPAFSPPFQPSLHLTPETPRTQQQHQQQPKNSQVFINHLRGILLKELHLGLSILAILFLKSPLYFNIVGLHLGAESSKQWVLK